MKIGQILSEKDIVGKLLVSKNPSDVKSRKMIPVMWKHDVTVPKHIKARLGPSPSPDEILKAWSDLIDKALSNTNFGDLSADGKFDMWLAKSYADGISNYEDITGEGVDALGAWRALSIRNLLKPEHQDLNRFRSIDQIHSIIRQSGYRQELQRIRNNAEIEKHKKEKVELVLINDDRFQVSIPFNYGACYTFNNAHGYTANFCTGSSSGFNWFKRYAEEGLVVDILDKQNLDKPDGKWQFHAQSNQLVNADQERRYDLNWNDAKFAKLFPGLMKRIVDAIIAHGDQISELSAAMMKNFGAKASALNPQKEAEEIKNKFPISYNSGEATLPQADQNQSNLI